MNHSCIAIKEDERDYVFGSASELEFKAVNDSGDWSAYIDFFERQKFGFETDGCVLFTAQESFDAQVNHLIETGAFPQSTMDFFYSNGYMETSTLDNNQPRFHTSPRFLHVLAGTRHNGTPLQSPWDILRKQGALPWGDLPFDEYTTEAAYFSAIPQMMLDKAKKILPYLTVQYQWIAKGGTGTPITKMKNALKQAPLCIGTAVCQPWNQDQPPVCPSTAPEHSTMVYKMDTLTHILDHYVPFEKTLLFQYNIPFVFQGVVSVVPQAPSPPPPAPEISTPITPTEKFDLLTWLGIAYQWLLNLKGRVGFTSNMENQYPWWVSSTGQGIAQRIISFVALLPPILSIFHIQLAQADIELVVNAACILFFAVWQAWAWARANVFKSARMGKYAPK